MTRRPTVAILGASEDRRKFGNKSLRAHMACGYEVFPVNPKGGSIEGLPAYARLVDVPGALDRVSVYLPPARTLAALEEIAAKGCRELWLNPGTADAAVRARAAELGLRVIEGCSIVDLGVSPGEFPD
jgi:predicted CoA-binding protein